jgi:tetratricopeptide (TPR) repeat protein
MAALVGLALALGASAQEPLRLEADGGTVRAMGEDGPAWENIHDRAGRFRDPQRPGRLSGPIEAGGAVWYALGVSLFEVEPASGFVRRRVLLPAPAGALRAEGEEVVVVVSSEQPRMEWKQTYRLRAGAGEVPFFLAGSLQSARMARLDAQMVLDGLLVRAGVAVPPGSQDEWRRQSELRPAVEAAAAELARLQERDPTNPWYSYYRGIYLDELGEDALAELALQEAVNVAPQYRFELLGMVQGLDERRPALADEAFARALGFLRAHGYEPELMHALIGLMVHYGPPAEPRPGTDEQQRMQRLGARLWELAPLAEGAAYFYQGLAEAERRAGRSEQAERWAARAQAAAPYAVLGPSAGLGEEAGLALNVYLGCLLATVLLFAVKLVRDAGVLRRARETRIRRWLIFPAWSRGELAGFVLLQPVLLGALYVLARGVAAVGLVAALPLAALNGSLGHPDAVEYLERLRGSEEGDFVHALALQQAGDLEAAEARYRRLALPRAKVNLGVLHERRGEMSAARALYEQALAAEPDLAEAAANLGQPARSARVERARRQGVSGPLLALPTPELWNEALKSSVLSGGLTELSFAGGEAVDLAGEMGGLFGRPQWLDLVMTFVPLAAGLLALLCLLLPRVGAGSEARPERFTMEWGPSLIVPGTARALGVAGPLLLALWCSSLMAAEALRLSDGAATNILAAIATPNVSRMYGLSGVVISPLEALVRQAAGLWWALWLANALLVGALAWRARQRMRSA